MKQIRNIAAFIILSVTAFPVYAQQDLYQITRNGSVELPAETMGRADFDTDITLTGQAGTKSILRAPNDDAVIVAHVGSVVRLTDVILEQAGTSRFGIYVNGGRVELERCEISGAFSTAIYLAAGSILLKDCAISGSEYGLSAQEGTSASAKNTRWADLTEVGIFAKGQDITLRNTQLSNAGVNPIYVAGPVQIDLSDIIIESSSSPTRIALLEGVNGTISNIALTGAGGDGLFVQNGGAVTVSGLGTSPDIASGVIVQGAQSFEMSNFAIKALETPLQISGVRGFARASDGQLTAQGENYGVSVFENGETSITNLTIKGGEIGVFAQGPLGSMTIADNHIANQTVYNILLQNLMGSEAIATIADNRLIAGGEALSVAGLEGGYLHLTGNTIVTEGATALYMQNTGIALNEGNTIVAQAQASEQINLFYPDTQTDDFVILSDGRIEPLEGWFGIENNNTLLSHMDALRHSDNDDTRRQLARLMTEGGDVAVLEDIALELASSSSLSATEEETITFTLAPPAPDWSWSEEAIALVLTKVGEEPQVLYPRDFPASASPGQYKLSVDGQFQGIFNLDTDYEFQLGNIPGPYAIWRTEDGQKIRGPGLQLRADNALRRLAEGVRPLKIGEYFGFQTIHMARSKVDVDLVSQAVTAAADKLPDVMTRYSSSHAEENWDLHNALWHTQRMYFDILAEFGDPDHIDWILTQPTHNRTTDNGIRAAIKIEQRLGLLEGSRVLAHLTQALADDPTNSGLRTALTNLGRIGHAPAIDLIRKLHLADVEGVGEHGLAAYGMDSFYYLPPEQGLPLYRGFLQRLQRNTLAWAGGTEFEWDDLAATSIWRDARLAILYLSLHGTEEDKVLFDLPVPLTINFLDMSSIIADTSTVLDAYFGKYAPVNEWRVKRWSPSYGTIVCPALSLSDADRRDHILLTTSFALREALMRDLGWEYWQQNSRSLETSLRLASEMSRAHCGMTGTVVDLAMGENAAGEYARKLQHADLEVDWWVRPSWAAEQITKIGQGLTNSVTTGLSPYPPQQLLEQMAAIGPGHPDMGPAFRMWLPLLTDAFQSPQGFYPFGTERRLFRIRNEGGNGTLSMAGIVDFRLIPEDDKLTVAISNSILTPDFGGLAAMMTAPDREPYEANNHRKMLDYVRLERNGILTEGEYIATIDGGVHVFELPFDGDLNQTYLRVGMQFQEDKWPLDIALFDSQLSFQANLDRSRKLIGGETQ